MVIKRMYPSRFRGRVVFIMLLLVLIQLNLSSLIINKQMHNIAEAEMSSLEVDVDVALRLMNILSATLGSEEYKHLNADLKNLLLNQIDYALIRVQQV